MRIAKRLFAVTMNMEQASDKESIKTFYVGILFQLLQFRILIKINAYSDDLISQLFRKIIKLFFLFLQRAASILRRVYAAIKPCSFHTAPPYSQLV